MLPCDVFSIGHSNIPAERFLALLQRAGVNAVADVRCIPHSRFCPWFSQKPLAAALSAAGIGYSAMGAALGGRPRSDKLYREGMADYEAMGSSLNMSPALIGCSKSRRSRAFVCCAPSVNRSIAIAVSWLRAASPNAASPSVTSFMTARSRRMLRLNGGCLGVTRKMFHKAATCSRLDSTTDSRQRIAAGRALSRSGGKLPHPETLRSGNHVYARPLDRRFVCCRHGLGPGARSRHGRGQDLAGARTSQFALDA